METLAALGHGFAVALTPYNLLWSALGVTVGTAIGVLPGIGPALTVALLLPVTYNLDPDLRLHHVRRHLLRRHVWRLDHLDPAQHAGRIGLDRDRHRRPRDGPQGPRRAGAGDGRDRLVRRRHHRDLALTFVAPLMVKLALLFGPAEYFALMVLALTTVTAVLGDCLARGLASLFIGLALGLVGIDLQTGQARFTLGIPETAGRHRHGGGRRRACSRSARPSTSPPDTDSRPRRLRASRARCG